jgi:hypothetical protein
MYAIILKLFFGKYMNTTTFLHPVKKNLINYFGNSFIYTTKTALSDYFTKSFLLLSIFIIIPSLFVFSLPVNLAIIGILSLTSFFTIKYINPHYILKLFNKSSIFSKLALFGSKPLYYKLNHRKHISQYMTVSIIESMEIVLSKNILNENKTQEFKAICDTLKILYMKKQYNEILTHLDKLEYFINNEENALLDSLIQSLNVLKYDSTYGKKKKHQEPKTSTFFVEKEINA